jgi:hypothetical protein
MAAGPGAFLECAQHDFVQNKMNDDGSKKNNTKDNH